VPEKSLISLTASAVPDGDSTPGTIERDPQAKLEEITNWMERQIQIQGSAPRLSSQEEDNLLGNLDI
jgi:hypothetical protein